MKMTTRRPRLSPAEALVAGTAEWVPTTTDVDSFASALADAPLFSGMAVGEVAAVLAEFDEVRYPSGQRVVLEGLRGRDFFIVLVGVAAVVSDGRRVATLGPGDFFGEIAILGAGPRTASVRADTPLHCLVLPNGKLEDVLRDHPQLGLNVLHTVVGRFAKLAGRRQPAASELSGS
jgi:CRP-like cAMP-binding protein